MQRNAVDHRSDAADVASIAFLVGDVHLGNTEGSHSGQNRPGSYALNSHITLSAMSMDRAFEASDSILDPALANATMEASIWGDGIHKGQVANEKKEDLA